MAIDARRLFSKTTFELKLHELEPQNIEPLGDRYIIEEIKVDEAVEFGQLLVVTEGEARPEDDPRNPMARPNVERRGVMPGVIVGVGNGHLLGFPDQRLEIGGVVHREAADVPMFAKPGDVVLVDVNNRGRALRYVGRLLRVVNQIDVLSIVRGVRLKWTENGWERE